MSSAPEIPNLRDCPQLHHLPLRIGSIPEAELRKKTPTRLKYEAAKNVQETIQESQALNAAEGVERSKPKYRPAPKSAHNLVAESQKFIEARNTLVELREAYVRELRALDGKPTLHLVNLNRKYDDSTLLCKSQMLESGQCISMGLQAWSDWVDDPETYLFGNEFGSEFALEFYVAHYDALNPGNYYDKEIEDYALEIVVETRRVMMLHIAQQTYFPEPIGSQSTVNQSDAATQNCTTKATPDVIQKGDSGPGPKRKNATFDAERRAEKWLSENGKMFPGIRPLARILGIRHSTLKDAIDGGKSHGSLLYQCYADWKTEKETASLLARENARGMAARSSPAGPDISESVNALLSDRDLRGLLEHAARGKVRKAIRNMSDAQLLNLAREKLRQSPADAA